MGASLQVKIPRSGQMIYCFDLTDTASEISINYYRNLEISLQVAIHTDMS